VRLIPDWGISFYFAAVAAAIVAVVVVVVDTFVGNHKTSETVDSKMWE